MYINCGRKWMIFSAVVIIMVIAFSVRVSGNDIHESNYEQAEAFRQKAPKDVRHTLENHLFSNSGVMLTASFENEYVTGYTMMISNEHFGKLDDISKQVLSVELEKVMMDAWDDCRMDDSDTAYPHFSVVIN